MKNLAISTMVVISIMIATLCTGATTREFVDSTTASLDQMVDMNVSDGTLLLVLSKLAVDHRVPIGFEHAIDSRDTPNRHIRIQTGTLKSILDSLIAQEPNYSGKCVTVRLT